MLLLRTYLICKHPFSKSGFLGWPGAIGSGNAGIELRDRLGGVFGHGEERQKVPDVQRGVRARKRPAGGSHQWREEASGIRASRRVELATKVRSILLYPRFHRRVLVELGEEGWLAS